MSSAARARELLSRVNGELSSTALGRDAEELARKYGVHRDQAARYIELLGSAEEAERFLAVGEEDIPKTVRANTLRITREELMSRLRGKGADVAPMEHVPYGVVVRRSPIALAAYHEHLMGLYYIQGPASMLPAIALGAEGASRVADAAAGVGGKATQMAQHNPDAPIAALDVSERKLMALKANVSRLGVFNVAAYLMDARELPSLGQFDRVLLDAPCTGEGLMPFSRGRRPRDQAEVSRYAELQAELLESALRALGKGGELVYSTCSVNFEENELVVSAVLDELGEPFEVVDTGLPYGDPGVQEYAGVRARDEVKMCRRYFPHRHRTEGFTICKLRRAS